MISEQTKRNIKVQSKPKVQSTPKALNQQNWLKMKMQARNKVKSTEPAKNQKTSTSKIIPNRHNRTQGCNRAPGTDKSGFGGGDKKGARCKQVGTSYPRRACHQGEIPAPAPDGVKKYQGEKSALAPNGMMKIQVKVDCGKTEIILKWRSGIHSRNS